jgi:Holliday junction resolvasome RuvABC endonuclease subunit
MELFQDLGNRPIVFIRFNPDSYIDEEDNEVKSSFKYHSSLGVPFIRDKDEWNNRLQKLKDTLDYHLHNIPTKEVTVENLFYDQNI